MDSCVASPAPLHVCCLARVSWMLQQDSITLGPSRSFVSNNMDVYKRMPQLSQWMILIDFLSRSDSNNEAPGFWHALSYKNTHPILTARFCKSQGPSVPQPRLATVEAAFQHPPYPNKTQRQMIAYSTLAVAFQPHYFHSRSANLHPTWRNLKTLQSRR